MYALLIDTVSIQKFVFGSNRLRDNIGASFLVQSIFEKNFIENLKSKPLLEDDGSYKGYVGGGNALYFFLTKDEAVDFVKEWSLKLLIETPGLTTAVSISEFFITDNNDIKFQPQLKELFNQLHINKTEYVANTIIPKHGITADCERSGFSKDVWINLPEKEKTSGYYSSQVKAKISAAEDALVKLNSKFKKIFNEKFKFTNDLEKLGRSLGEDSHLSIVHIDGNSMGQKFQSCKTLSELRELSNKVEKATQESFNELLITIINEWDFIKHEIKPIEDEGKTIIPIRPIIIGGDDITFVCDGRLGIYFAKIYMEAFEKHIDLDGNNLTSCAGVSIIKLKYPFYRGYQIAESLCGNAKAVRTKKTSPNSWIDFHISSGNISGSLEEIRERNYMNGKNELLKRPYKVGDSDSVDGFDTFVKNTAKLFEIKNGKYVIPQSKIKELRTILTLDEAARKQHRTQLTAAGHKLPIITNTGYFENYFSEGHTIYFDMIELNDVYPQFDLKRRGLK